MRVQAEPPSQFGRKPCRAAGLAPFFAIMEFRGEPRLRNRFSVRTPATLSDQLLAFSPP
jgi:hypothetical protein